jgi:hypothetical protein
VSPGILASTVPEREATMRLVKRFALALGTLAAVLLAGGAHYRL